MDGDLRDAVTDDCIHGFSYGAKWWFVEAPEIQLRFRSGQRVDRKLALHERKQVWLGRGFPFEKQRVTGVEIVSATFSSTFLTEICFSFDPTPPMPT
jgi:hypothetical protein